MAVKKKKVITMQEYIQKNDIKPTFNLTDIAPVASQAKTDNKKTSTKEDVEEKRNLIDGIAPTTVIPSHSNMTMNVYEQAKNTKKKTDEENQKWYQGWLKQSEGNFGQAVKASGVDLLEDATTGIVGGGESTIDALMAFAPAMNNLNKINSGQMLTDEDLKKYNEQKKYSEEFIKKDLFNESEIAKRIITTPFEQKTGIDVESMSVFDVKADSLAQSGGQMLMSVGAGAINPMLGSSLLGASAFGSEMENALNEGATYDEAMLSSAITAGAEILTEKISGGISLGGKTLDDLIPVDKLAQGISNKVVRNLISIGVDATGEGFEEIVSGVLSAVGQKMTYMEEKEIKELFSSEEALDSFLGGAILGGISGTGEVAINSVTGNDSLSGLSKHEKAVFDKVYNDAVAKKEKEGKKLTRKEKNEIYDEVMEKMERGSIDTDTIGSMFAEESYKKYRESAEKEETDLKTQTAKLEELKNKLQALDGEPDTVGNPKRYDAIEKQIEETEKKIEEIKNNSDRLQLQSKMDAEVFELVKGTKLAESYHEKARRRQHFEADLTKYDSKQRAVIQDAIDSGVLNNTKRTHEFVDWLARVSADKGVSFDFMNNQRLRESGFALEGKTVNGFRQGNKIAINIQSGNELRTVVGHEITHVLEGSPEFYNALASSIKTFAEAKGIYKSMYDTAFENYKNIYKGMTEEDYKKAIEKEVVADLVGEYIFSDKDFVRSLSAKNRNVFEKVYDEIKYFLKTVTAGSDAEKQLLKVKKTFEEVYRESNSENEESVDVQYSISTEHDSLPKPKPSLDPTSAQLQKDTRSVRDIRNDTMLKNGYSIEEVEQTNQFFDEIGEFMKKAGMTYKYIGLDDVNNAKLKITYDNDGNPQKIVLSAMVKNGDYPVNFDFTSICKKRQSISLVVKELAKRQTDGKRTLDVVNMSAESLWKINEELRKEGLETACLGCFVESKRYNIQNFSAKATNMWNKIVNEVRKEQGIEGAVEYFNFAEGTDIDSVDYAEVDRIFKDYAKQPNRTSPENRMRALIRSGGAMYQKYLQPSDIMTPEGIEAIKSMSSKKNNFYGILQGVYGQASPKEVMGFSPYNSEIALLPEKKGRQQMTEYIKSIGGVRMQSFSDFLVANVYDYMQMVGDLASRRLPAHAYTKEIAFAKIFGMTGIKVNMSVMFDIDSNLPNEYAGLTFVEDENGDEEYNGVRGRFEYLVADQKRSDAEYEKTGNRPYVQSIPFDEAVALQRDARYSKNVGIIGVGYSDNHILKMLGDDDIRYVIPYHASSLPAIIKDASKIRKATDYTDSQTIRKLKSITDENGNTVDFNEFRKQFGTVAEAYGKLNELVQNEGWQVQYGGQGKSKFNLYKDIEKTNDPRQTVENYLEYCAKNGLMPVFDQFAGHENYYKLIYDFDPYDSVTGEYAPQTAVSNIYDGYNASEGELSTEAIQELIDGEMFIQNEKNRVRNEKIPSVVDSVLDQLGMKEDVQHSISDESQVTEKSSDGIYGEDIAFVDDANIAPTTADTTEEMPIRSDYAPLTEHIPAKVESKGEYISIRPKQSKGEPRMVRVKPSETDVAPSKEDSPIAQVLTEEPAPENKKSRFWEQAMELVADKGFVFENLSKKTKNRELEAKWNFIRYADSKAQDFIGNGAEGVKALNDIREEVTQAGLYKELSEYVYHLHNIDRMNLSERYEDAENKPVFGDSVTADVSRSAVAELEARHPELKRYANEIYSINNYLRGLLVESGVISQETADLWAEMYPHYVPIGRAGDHSLHINVPLDTGRTGINAPVKKATGGSSDILPLFDTIAQRALQTYKAVAKNRFGVELKNTLGTTIGTEIADVDSVIEGVAQNEELLQKGKNGRKPTFTVFEGGEKVTFEITETMYDALKPTNEALTYTNNVANKISNFHRGVLTEYNPSFLARNIIKDVQDVLINSQHPAKTYASFPKAIKEIVTNGEMYKEYVKNGGEQNSYFDKKTNTFVKDKSKLVKAVGMPLNAISVANNFIEKLPRLAEYIASRESGRSVEVSMLDSARVTTNFSAGGDLTKFANRNGATFLNASVQGAMQQVRNIREAKMNGLKGWTQLATKCAVAGLPVVLLNSLLWDDDEEYAELSDYVKQNYYIVAKYGDGKFVRIPKGRTLSVIQNALEQTMNAVTGNDEVDLKNFLQLAVSNLAPNNPIENNILAPIIQVKNNETWYGDDLVPTRLQDLPAEEQFDESTDSISIWLGEKTGFSPYKINYLLDQYTGGVGDSVLPMLTPEAESEEDTTIGKLTAPIRSSFTTDSVLKNQNVSDFYDKKDELTTNAKGKGATDKDVLSNKYFNSVNTEIGKLYGEKRDIQSGNYTDSEKYYYVRDVQRKINSLAEEALNEYDKVTIDGSYATVGGKHYKLTDDGWEKITDDQVVKMKEVMSGLGITAGEYWGNKQEYDMKYKYPEKYKVLQEQGISVEEYKENFEETAFIYTDDYSWASDNPEKYTISKVISDDVRVYKQYTSELNAIRGDDAKEKKKNYIFGLDLDDGQKALLYRSIYSSKEDKKKYNAYIVEYLNSRDDISYEEMVTILEELDFEVYSDGTVKW